MRVIGVIGWSGSGKTTLVIKLVHALTNRGLLVSTIKHAHPTFDIDLPGKDSYEHRAAGATEVLVSSSERWALVHEHRGDKELNFENAIALLKPVDIVIIEGYKFGTHAKIELHSAKIREPLLAMTDPHIIAIATDTTINGISIPIFHRDDIEAITEFIIAGPILSHIYSPADQA